MAVEIGKLPYRRGLETAAGSNPERVRDWILHGGEEYQLLFTGDFGQAELEAMAAHATVTRIGTVEAGEGVDLLDASGSRTALAPGGWNH
jgi:thiamine-monophosphate kinase